MSPIMFLYSVHHDPRAWWESVNTAVDTNDNDDQYTLANNFRNCAYADEMHLM